MTKSFATVVVIALNLFLFTLYAQIYSGDYYTSFDSSKIYYELKGTGYPVILIHGFMNTGENMKRMQFILTY